MKIRNLMGEEISVKEEDSRLIKWLKKVQIKHGSLIYEFDSLVEFETYSLNEGIKKPSGILMSHIKVDSVLQNEYGVELTLVEGPCNISFKKIRPGHREDWGVKDTCWLELHKLKNNDELRMLSFIYHHHSIYQLVDLKRKDDGNDYNGIFEFSPNNNGGQSVDELIAETYKK